MRISGTVSKHLHENLPVLKRLCREKKQDKTVLALVLCEMYFTSRVKRLLEYGAWLVLTLLCSKRRHLISVGIGQIQIRHWIEQGYITDRVSILNFNVLSDPSANYDVAQKLVNCSLTHTKLLASYRGEARAYHLKVYQEIRKQLDQLRLNEHLSPEYTPSIRE
jgi:hypothetical protein